MPELPEVVTVCKILNQEVVGKTIQEFQIYYTNLLLKPSIEEFKTKVKNQKILKVYNKAKYIIFELKTDLIISHLRMEGRWAFEKPELYSYGENALEAQFLLDDGMMLRYYDFRRFGTLELISKEESLKVPPLSKIGPEANDKTLTGTWLHEKFSRIKKSIKVVLLDQNLISGIGNIYDNEILFSTKIKPHTPAKDLSVAQCEDILRASREILDKAIKYGGTTIHNFAPKFGVSGGYQDFLLVHGKNGRPCPICGQKIVKEMLGGRGTYYCPGCQR